ncbi:MAG: ATP-binding cassette domain-containing protein [Hydrogenophaga sp.]|uniref:ATP-binding cassette domain-containing protein n=1 Tax=Hydrogenophaga crocea TaxID=2716225 RepID=A0A6G8IM19_9BURK|nr:MULTISPECIES: ATP-binding cassette domain-containing protein [Hydrogenophaga]MBL0944720.1 ATP-binding cassette domain-containing protein [Hydrogenophaga sp.]QIM54224.1 ATP-binding cassette domain-containing protein [Hydrogenophaga crocea]
MRLAVQDLEMRFGERLIQRGVSFEVPAGTIFAVMGGSGCGKSTLLKHLVGLLPPAAGRVLHDGEDFWAADEAARQRLRGRFGMLFQSAALWSSMTLLENVCLALAQQTALEPAAQAERAREVLAWVGLAAFADYFPGDLSGGMKKRAGLARAIAAEPPLLFLDEPSAGLDPISSRKLDELILDIRERTGTAVVFVSHELPSLFAIADDGIFLDADSKTPIARGCPRELVRQRVHPTVDAFLRRELPPETAAPAAAPASGDPA